MKKYTKACSFLLLFVCSFAHGQMERYSHKRELKGISEQWHKIVLPDEIFGKVSNDLADIRVFGFTNSNDTIEAPYLIDLKADKVDAKEIAFRMLNASRDDRGYYFTFEVPTSEPVNQIQLDFEQNNFDWKVSLEGSQDQREWFTIVSDYRILSIKNDLTDFRFTQLTFPRSVYRYFRLSIDSDQKPRLNTARITQREITEGVFRKYPFKITGNKENKQTRQTEIDLEYPLPVPVSQLQMVISDEFDYYRPVTVQYLADSFQTSEGWRYNYRTLTSETLNSLEDNVFKFSSTVSQKLKVFIHNQSNRPLNINSIHVTGYVHELAVRFTEPASYFLVYGNKETTRPSYDIKHFTDNIPKELSQLTLGDELSMETTAGKASSALFEHKAWLWGIMVVIIALLGWFSLQMMRKK
ncbi:DUF3999 family protein [Negadavirga shengliensis]|uniref:DUF3999 family protein n=1 Tax=Negadavirga shengliensis TaxID=1389218 RepID=A0ABV9SWN9_9BACT